MYPRKNFLPRLRSPIVLQSGRNTPVWQCDYCKGPANWTFIGDDVYYYCQHQCDGFMQVDMFERSEYIDSRVSVSALRRGERASCDDLPF